MNARVAPFLALGVMVSACCSCGYAGDGPFVQKLEGTDVNFKMVPVPAGSFLMGSPESEKGRNKNEGPRHEVKVEAFFMEEHEVTWGEYLLFLHNYARLSNGNAAKVPADKLADAVTFPTPIYDVEAAPLLQRMGGRQPNLPAVIMSQFAARQYTKWLSKKTGRFYRLPSEAEWEYAARAGTQTAYFFGDDPSKLAEYAWFKDNSNEDDGATGYHPVMSKKPNPWDLYDMYGNVMEWCVDVFDANAYSKAAGKTLLPNDSVNWAGMTKTAYPRVLRGGGYDSEALECRSATRMASNRQMNSLDPDIPKSVHWLSDGFYIGFRVVSPAKEPTDAEKRMWWDADDAATINVLDGDKQRKGLVSQGAVER